MKTLIAAMTFVVLIGFAAVDQATALGQVYVGPTVVEAYYPPVPTYTYAAPAYAAPVVPVRRWVYSPVVAAPMVVPQPVVISPPLVVGRPVVIGPAGRIYIPGRPVRNTVRFVVP